MSASRRHGLEGASSLASMPLDGGGLAQVERFEASVGDEVVGDVWRPALVGGIAPPRPSLALAVEPEFESIAERALLYAAPRFEFDGSTVRAQIAFPKGTSFYGAGQVAAPLLRNGRTVVFW